MLFNWTVSKRWSIKRWASNLHLLHKSRAHSVIVFARSWDKDADWSGFPAGLLRDHLKSVDCDHLRSGETLKQMLNYQRNSWFQITSQVERLNSGVMPHLTGKVKPVSRNSVRIHCLNTSISAERGFSFPVSVLTRKWDWCSGIGSPTMRMGLPASIDLLAKRSIKTAQPIPDATNSHAWIDVSTCMRVFSSVLAFESRSKWFM